MAKAAHLRSIPGGRAAACSPTSLARIWVLSEFVLNHLKACESRLATGCRVADSIIGTQHDMRAARLTMKQLAADRLDFKSLAGPKPQPSPWFPIDAVPKRQLHANLGAINALAVRPAGYLCRP